MAVIDIVDDAAGKRRHGLIDEHAETAGNRVHLKVDVRVIRPVRIEKLAEAFVPHRLRGGVMEVAHRLLLRRLGLLSRLGLFLSRRSFTLCGRSCYLTAGR